MSLASNVAQTPYCFAAAVNFQKLTSLFKAKRDSAEEHIWESQKYPFGGIPGFDLGGDRQNREAVHVSIVVRIIPLALVVSKRVRANPRWIEPKKMQTSDDMFLSKQAKMTASLQQMKLSDEKAKILKGKSNGQQEMPDVTEAEPADEIPQAPREMLFVVAPRVYKVFSSIFFNPNQTNAASLMAWKDLRYAMIQIGFGIQPVDGSEWIFYRKGLRSIKVDDPHGEKHFSRKKTRKTGGRMNRLYG